MLKEGKTANEIARGKQESRKWSKSTVRNAKNLKMAKKTLRKDNSSAKNSQRSLANKLGISQPSINRIISDLDLRPLKLACTTHNNGTKQKKRVRIANQILNMYSEGMKTKRIFWIDETRADKDSAHRFNAQNERKYFS